VRKRMKPESMVPFLEHIGATTIRFDRLSSVVELETRDDLVNHVGSLHAAVVFSVAECAAGALLTHNFDVGIYLPLLKSMEIKYRAPVFKKAVAFASISEEVLKKAEEELTRSGKSDFTIDIRIENEEGMDAAKVSILWALRSMTPSRI